MLALRAVAAGLIAVSGAWVLPSPAAAQASAPTAPASAGAPSAAARRLEEWRRGRARVYMNDFGEGARYRDANARLEPPAPGERRVVFFGDSITDMWRLGDFFPGRPYLNRGISGQTTAQMLVRFRQDVIDLHPRAVVILAGTNDIAGNTGPTTLAETEGHLASMAELAHAHGIRVVLSSVIPVHDYTPESAMTFPLRPPEKIRELNRWLAAYAASHGHVYLDYASAMSDDRGLLRRELAQDGLHPGRAGYQIMASLAAAAIATALKAPAPGR